MIPVIVLIVVILIAVVMLVRRKPDKQTVMPPAFKEILTQHVAFYRALGADAQALFEDKIREFLGYVRIHGVGTEVDDIDRLLIASSAVIPIFGFPEWKYYNLKDILLYPNSFDEASFSTNEGGNVLGMVGSGAMQRMMILSKPDLHSGFDHFHGKENTGIHEFVHLLDKADGAVDGLPEALLDKKYALPWLHLLAENIAAIKAGKSDINPYGATNQAEFFAVAAEYFFENPERFREKHAELYTMMTSIFSQHPGSK